MGSSYRAAGRGSRPEYRKDNPSLTAAALAGGVRSRGRYRELIDQGSGT
jgi:hypothetical protein